MSENRGNKTLADEFIPYRLSWANAPINVKPAGWGRGGRGKGMGWGFDCRCCPWGTKKVSFIRLQ